MRRIGIIQFVNSIPFLHGLDKYAQVFIDTPRNLAMRFMNGELDAAFIPVVAYLQNKDKYFLVDGVSISSFGSTNSVFIASKTELEEIRIVKEHPASLSSNFISKIILSENYGVKPLFIDDEFAKYYDARVIIGDEALVMEQNNYSLTLDIGREWDKLTGLPMVYAVCAAKTPYLAEEIGNIIKERLNENISNLNSLLLLLNMENHYLYLKNLNYSLSNYHITAMDKIYSFMLKERKLCLEKY